MTSSPLPPSFVAALIVLGTAVSLTVVPGVFTADDNNYLINVLSLRQGRFTVANTEGLSPSQELLAFDPGPWTRSVESTPVASTAPPLYAVLALPFSSLGWRGLVALNALAYLATIIVVFLYSKRYATGTLTPWLAAAAFALGGFVVEYAQGVWPHALSIALCTGGIMAAGYAIDPTRRTHGTPFLAAAAGFLLSLATGVRYQNAVILAVVGGGIALWSAHRWKALAAFVPAAALPLATSAAINHIRLGSWNPISKGPGYLVNDSAGALFDPLTMFWARIVDFSVRPPLVGFSWVTYDPATGVHRMLDATVQKAFLQSAPWAILALLLFSLTWLPWLRISEARRSGTGAVELPIQQRQIRLLSLVTLAVVATFAFSDVHRHEGLSFNQRYLLELMPLAAVGFAWALDGLTLRVRHLLAGGVLGALIVVLILHGTPIGGASQEAFRPLREFALLKIPLLLSATLSVLWIVARSRENSKLLLAATTGLCLGWGLTLHLADDVTASHRLRAENLAASLRLGPLLPDRSVLLAYSGFKEAAFPLLFHRDIVILDARADEGKDAPLLIRELMDRNRRVFVLTSGFPDHVLSGVFAGWAVVPIGHPDTHLVELRAESDGT